MAATAQVISAPQTAPAEWAYLPPYDGEQGTLWQVWMREKGMGYWLMRCAVRLANVTARLEARLRGRPSPHPITNPNALEDGGAYVERGQAEDLCRIAYRAGKAATICPVIVGRAYSVERVKAAGDFDPFKAFDFSATEAVKSQARYVLVPARELEELRAILTGTEPRA